MEKAIYCKNCGSANLIDNTNEDFSGSCHHCGEPIEFRASGISPNTIIDSRYQIREILDEDSHSNIYFALDYSTNDLVIIRVFCWDYSYSITNTEEFLHLNESVSLLAQPNHVQIIDWGIDDDLMYTVWPGDSIETVEKLLGMHNNFEPDVAVSIIKEAALCLSGAFNELGIGHYALSPKNLYLDSRGSVKISELGFAAQLFKDENFIDSGVDFYDWHYQAPEIILDWHPPDIRCDMFSLGYCLYTMLTGEVPFDRMRPISQGDYERIGFARSDQYRYGDTFMDLFHGLTATNPSERFSSWKDAISFMDYYLQEEKLMKQSALSGRRRSMTTSFNMDLIRDFDKPAPIKVKTSKKRKKAMSASDIRQKSTVYVSDQPRRMKGKTITPLAKKKTRENPMPIIVGVIAALFAVIMIIVAAQSHKDNNNVSSNSSDNTKQPEKEERSSSKKSPEKTQQNQDSSAKQPNNEPPVEDKETETNPVPNPGKKKPANDLDDFNEMTFMVREYTIRKDWESALKLIDAYKGPLKDRQKNLREEIVRKRLEYLNRQVSAKETNIESKENPPPLPEPPTEVVPGATLEALAQRIYAGNTESALLLLPLVEQANKIDLHLLKGILEGATDKGIEALIAENYSKEIGKNIELTIEGVVTKGQIRQVIPEEASIKMNVVFLTRQLERIYKFSQIDPLENVKRIVRNDPNESIFLQFLYLVRKKKFKAAQHTLLKYDGVLKKELIQTMEQYKNQEAAFAWNKLLKSLKIAPKATDNEFVDQLNKVNMSEDDSWVFFYNLKDFNTRFSTTQYFQDIKHLVTLTVKAFEKQINLLKKPDAVVSANGRPGTISLESALREIGDGGTVRILPGTYGGSSSVNSKIRLIGAEGVYFNGTVALTTDRIEIRNIVLKQGFIDVYRKVRDIKIYNCEVRKNGVIMRGDNTNVTIENTVMYGLKVGDNRQTVIKDSVILENPEKNNGYTISGFVSGPISNSIIRSKTAYAIRIQEKVESTLSLRYCMVFGLKGICYINDGRESIQGENDFNRKAGRAVQLRIAQPQFVDEANFDFRLKDFSPGFFEGENKKCIGVQYNYSK